MPAVDLEQMKMKTEQMGSGLEMTVFFPFSIGYFLPFISWIPGRVALARDNKCRAMRLNLPLTFLNSQWQTTLDS